ncbi:TRAP transporter small permease [Enterovirga sp. CN4-39]|uniref:TRAP transporter small permease n=1 Tax=Enterovirga sp. CN4-39 TaxID=3400910 RepID=UPI003C0904EB
MDRLVLSVNRWLMILALAAMSVIVFLNVALRYLTDDSIVWSEEVARYLMVWLTFLGIGPVFRLGGHVGVDTLLQSVSAKSAILLRTLIFVLLVGFSAITVWAGYVFVERSLAQSTPVTEVSFALVAAAVPIGFALALWHMSAVCFGYVSEFRFETSPDLSPDEAGAA